MTETETPTSFQKTSFWSVLESEQRRQSFCWSNAPFSSLAEACWCRCWSQQIVVCPAAKQWHNYTMGHFRVIGTATQYEYSGVGFCFSLLGVVAHVRGENLLCLFRDTEVTERIQLVI